MNKPISPRRFVSVPTATYERWAEEARARGISPGQLVEAALDATLYEPGEREALARERRLARR